MTELNKNPELTAEEVAAMQTAEAEAIAFYDEVDEWDEECQRLSELRNIVTSILHNRHNSAYSLLHFKYSETLLTYDEKGVLVTVGRDAAKEKTPKEVRRATQILKWARKVNSAYSSMRRGTLETVNGVPNALIMEIK